jgi:hypothetical protein
MPPLLPSAALTTASSLRAVITAPSTASARPGSGTKTRCFSRSSVCPIRLLRSSSGLPTRGRSWGFACTMAAKAASSAAIGDTVPAPTACHCAAGIAGASTRRWASGWSRSSGRCWSLMTAEHGQRLVEFASRDEQGTRALVELLARECASTRGLPASGRLCAAFVPCPGEAEALRRLGDGVVQRHRVLDAPGRDGRRTGREPFFHGVHGPRERGRVRAVDLHRIESVQAQVLVEPLLAALLLHRAALLDAASVEDHERGDEAAVLGAPPARRPVAAALLLEGAVAEEHHQPLAAAAACARTAVRRSRGSRPRTGLRRCSGRRGCPAATPAARPRRSRSRRSRGRSASARSSLRS